MRLFIYQEIHLLLLTFFVLHFSGALTLLPLNANEHEQSYADFHIGTHYYGFSECSWPVNYLNSVKESEIEHDLKEIKGLGFDLIILLASWSEFQPEIGKKNNDAYRKINQIISKAKELGLKVMIRIPYLWSLIGNKIRERIAYTLINHGDYRVLFFDFLKEFNNNVIINHDNIVSKFGTWEDFYILQDLFFANHYTASDIIKQAFLSDTGINPGEVKKNGINYPALLDWLDRNIQQLILSISQYGYEIRVDSDYYINNRMLQWYSHNKYYMQNNQTQHGALVTYWAPYYGQKNEGEKLNSVEAINSFSWMLNLVAEKNPQRPFIDQLNFYDNTPNTELNAEISESEYWPFFNKLAPIVTSRTNGYAFWTIKDYHHNLIFNPSFSEGLKGWKSRNIEITENGEVSILPGGYLSQKVNHERFHFLNSKKTRVLVSISTGDLEIEIKPVGNFFLYGKGRHEIEITLPPSLESIDITLRPLSDQSTINCLGLLGHTQISRALDLHGNKYDFFEYIQQFNYLSKKLSIQK